MSEIRYITIDRDGDVSTFSYTWSELLRWIARRNRQARTHGESWRIARVERAPRHHMQQP